jgi:TRAP-type C4-dicarboxylate transport system permease small subunit
MWQFWVFLYVSMAVSAHIELSPPDILGMLKGLLVIVILFFLINVIYVVFFNQSPNFINKGIPAFSYLNQVFVLALIFSFLNFLISLILGNLWSLIRNQSMVNPFTR